MIRAAILGAGFIAGFHADAYQQNPDAALCAICDRDQALADAAAARYGCRAYTDYHRLLAVEKPDVVSVCLPTWLHPEATAAALQAGAHVLCEKPMALTLEDCRTMAETARLCRRTLMIGQVLRWWPEYVLIREQLRRLGPPRHIRASRLQHAARGGWFMDPLRGGGALFDLLVHDLDFICSLSPTPPKVLAAQGWLGGEGSWRHVCAELSLPDGGWAELEACNCMPAGYPFTAAFQAVWDQAALEYTFRAPVNIGLDVPAEARFLLYEGGRAQVLPVRDDAQVCAFRAEISALIDGIQHGTQPLPPEDTLRSMETLFRIRELLEAG